MKKKSKFEVVKIDKKVRSAIVRYHSQRKGDVDVELFFHFNGDIDFENFERLTEKEFQALNDFAIFDEKLNEAFPFKD